VALSNNEISYRPIIQGGEFGLTVLQEIVLGGSQTPRDGSVITYLHPRLKVVWRRPRGKADRKMFSLFEEPSPGGLRFGYGGSETRRELVIEENAASAAAQRLPERHRLPLASHRLLIGQTPADIPKRLARWIASKNKNVFPERRTPANPTTFSNPSVTIARAPGNAPTAVRQTAAGRL
jgi:hypothetical protein